MTHQLLPVARKYSFKIQAYASKLLGNLEEMFS